MSATFTVQLTCDCGCAHVTTHGCWVGFPGRPTEDSATNLRALAAGRGWQVLRRGVKGRDVCPPCRIVEIRKVAGIAEEGDA